LAQGIKKSLRLWMSQPVRVPGSSPEANSSVSYPINKKLGVENETVRCI
jgi:hypothetical protein